MNSIIVIFALLASLLTGVEVTIPPCATDEAPEAGISACYWDGATRGNGQGGSFIWTGSHTIHISK